MSGYPQIGSETYVSGAGYPISPKPFNEVRLTDSFWKPIVDINARVTVPFEAGHKSIAFEAGHNLINYNVLEAVVYSLQTHPNPDLQAFVDEIISELTANLTPGNRFLEPAAAIYKMTGRRELLDLALQRAEDLFEDFRVNQSPFTGHERDTIACLQLYKVTGDKKHLDLAKHYLDIRGLESSRNRSRHNQSYKPVLEQSEAIGHAVNCATLMLSLLDVGELTGIGAYTDAALRMWEDTVTSKMYITGGVGTTGEEGFGLPFSLPNIDAYAETCAVLMFMMFNHRLFMKTGDAKYIDVMERGLYNNTLSGISKDGELFFYVNRLSSAGDGRDTRWQHASLECCPPNIIRFLATMPGYIYAQNDDIVYVNLYLSSEASFSIGGKELEIAVNSEMPWGGKSKLTISTRETVTGSLKLRVPGWARDVVAPGGLYAYDRKISGKTALYINGEAQSVAVDDLGYITLTRTWYNGDTVEIEFPMEVRQVVADDRIKEDRGRVAVERGPVVYCVEWPEVPNGKVFDLLLEKTGSVEQDDYMGIVINSTFRSVTNPSVPSKSVKLIPYYLWANRGAGEMSVWLPIREFIPGDIGPAGGYIFYDNPNYTTDGWRYLEAARFDQGIGVKWGCFRHEIEGAKGRAIGTGKQNTADMMAGCSDAITAATICVKDTFFGVSGWFLPSIDELAMMYKNLCATCISDFGTEGTLENISYWSSTQQTADMSNNIDFADLGRPHYDDKDYPRRVRAIRQIELGTD